MNYITTEKVLLAVVFACEKFRSYLVCSPVIVFSDHATLKYLLFKKDSKARLYGEFCYFKNSISQSRIRKTPKMLSWIICQD